LGGHPAAQRLCGPLKQRRRSHSLIIPVLRKRLKTKYSPTNSAVRVRALIINLKICRHPMGSDNEPANANAAAVGGQRPKFGAVRPLAQGQRSGLRSDLSSPAYLTKTYPEPSSHDRTTKRAAVRDSSPEVGSLDFQRERHEGEESSRLPRNGEHIRTLSPCVWRSWHAPIATVRP
jgi:hypothetical protein